MSSRTTILIAHRSSTLRLADRVLVIDAGRIVAEGTNAELWHSSKLYRELLTGPELELPDDFSEPIDAVSAAAWPRSGDRDGVGSPQIEMATLLSGMAGGVMMHNLAGRSGLVAATPELLARVDALAPLHGDPDVDLADATTIDGSSTLRRMTHRFRVPLVFVGLLVLVDAATTLVGPLLIRHGLDSGVEEHRGDVLLAMCIAFLAVQLLSWGNQIV